LPPGVLDFEIRKTGEVIKSVLKLSFTRQRQDKRIIMPGNDGHEKRPGK
jgi:hypothetical protein